jgi:tetratricopeptide (TPR) repeat protein
MICSALLTQLLAGCATDRSQDAPSLLSELKNERKKENEDIRQASHKVAVDDEEVVGSRKVEDPLNLKLHYARWMEQLKNYPDARTHYGDILKERPENVEAIIGMARVDQAAGQLNEADAGFRKALALQPDLPLAQHAYGKFLLAQDRLSEALPLLNKAMVAEPNNNAYRYQMAVALAKSGDVNAALPHFKRTVGDAAAHHNIGIILRDKADLAGAEQHFRQALTIDPELPQARSALAKLYEQRESQAQPQLASGTANGPVQKPNGSVTPTAADNSAQPRQTVTPTKYQRLLQKISPKP